MYIDDSNTERKGTSDVASHAIKQGFESPECEEGHFGGKHGLVDRALDL